MSSMSSVLASEQFQEMWTRTDGLTHERKSEHMSAPLTMGRGLTSSSAMAERPRDKLAILSGWVTLRLNFRLNGYVSRQYLRTVRCGNGYNTTLPLEAFTQETMYLTKELCSRLYSIEIAFNSKTKLDSLRWFSKRRSPTPHFWGLRTLTVERCKRKSVEVGVFIRGIVNFERKFQTEEASPTNHSWCQKTRVIALSCGIKISAVHCLVLSQSTRVTDGQTDSITTINAALA